MDRVPALPDDCLLLVFDRVPLHQLLTKVPLISRHWSRLIPVACRARTRLTVTVQSRDPLMAAYMTSANTVTHRIATYWSAHRNSRDSPTSTWYTANDLWQLNFAALLIEYVHRLATMLPNVRHLTYCHFGQTSEFLNGLLLFLMMWRNQLQSFTFWRYGSKHPSLSSSSIQRLFNTLNTMPELRRLTIDTDDRLMSKSRVPDLEILDQLEDFYLFSNDKAHQAVKMLEKYAAENPDLRRVRLRNDISDDETLMRFLHFEPKFAAKIENLLVYPSPETTWLHLDRLVSRFTGLTSVWFSCNGPLTVQSLVHALQPLKHLVQMGLRVNQEGLHEERKYSSDDRIPCLPGIRGLELTITASSHRWTPPIPWSKMMPNIEAIRYFNQMSSCDACPYKSSFSVSVSRRKECAVHFLSAFRACKRLRLVQSTFHERYNLKRKDLKDLFL